MWKYISLFGVLLATGSHANAYHKRDRTLPPFIRSVSAINLPT
ncbi:hypothetical protein A1F94_005806 [Pyrenophora tritici-repentis]|nr:hypothetical protein A1F99_062130 [Pyrenophora tritici-repentis]KAG9383895.1 hypothetical protein A1F94_005806 [Pyrenophora tritici-repentis]